MDKPEEAVSFFNKGNNCCQSIISTFAPDLGIDYITAMKLGAGFGAGVGYQGQTCGAVTGALMAIGLKHASEYSNNEAYRIFSEFAAKFKQKHGSTLCAEILGYNPGIPDEYRMINEKNLFSKLCPEFVRTSATLLLEYL